MENVSDKDIDKAIESCACFHFRRTARALTSIYDKALAPAGVRSGQFVLLLVIRHTKSITRNELADAVGLDQSALSRGLQAMERQKWIKSETGKDRRTRLVSLTANGIKKIEEGYPMWEAAQKQVKKSWGAKKFKEILAEVDECHERLVPTLENLG